MKRCPRNTTFHAVYLIPVWAMIILLYGSVSSSALHSLEVGMEAPDFTLTDLDGGTRTFADIRGEKLTVVLFWATWGENSKKALQQMQGLHQKYRNAGLSVIGINVDKQTITEETLARIREVSAAQKISFPQLVDRGLTTFQGYGIIAVPSTVILDAKRVIRHEMSGFPLMGAAGLTQFLEVAIENKKLPDRVVVTGYQPDKKAVRLWNMGMSSLKSERTASRAKVWFEKAIAADPAFTLPYISLGTLYYKQHNAVEAKKRFEQVLQRKPDHPIALCSLGQILLGEGDLAGAEEKLTRAVRAEESYLPCYYFLGLLKGRQGDAAQALQWFNRAEQLNSRDYKLYLHKGMMYEERNDLPDAVAGYKKALELIIEQP